jgi:hypothetical protein
MCDLFSAAMVFGGFVVRETTNNGINKSNRDLT